MKHEKLSNQELLTARVVYSFFGHKLLQNQQNINEILTKY